MHYWLRRGETIMRTCHVCNGKLAQVDDIRFNLDGHMFMVKGERCTNCGEELIGEKEGQHMIGLARKAGVWGEPLKLHRKLSKSGRGTVLRIPTDIEQNLHLKGNETVAISKVGPKKFLVEVE